MMKIAVLSLSLFFAIGCAVHKHGQEYSGVVDAACGECIFHMTGDACDLAVKIDGEHYFVEGSTVDEHGDAHAEDGLCSVARKAQVAGTIRGGVFYATSFELLEVEK